MVGVIISDGQLGVAIVTSSEPTIIELNDLKIKKISCGAFHSLLLSCDGDICAFGWNRYGMLEMEHEINRDFR